MESEHADNSLTHADLDTNRRELAKELLRSALAQCSRVGVEVYFIRGNIRYQVDPETLDYHLLDWIGRPVPIEGRVIERRRSALLVLKPGGG